MQRRKGKTPALPEFPPILLCVFAPGREKLLNEALIYLKSKIQNPKC